MKKVLKTFAALAASALVAGAMMATPAEAATNVTLKVWDAGLLGHLTDGKLDPKISFIYQAARAFEKQNLGVHIRISELDGGVADTQFRAASLAGNGPDIRIGFAGGGTLSMADFLQPLDSYFSKTELAQLKGVNTNRAGFKTSGSLLAVPIGAGSYFYVFYNKKIFKDAGVSMKTPPATWEDFLKLAKQLKAAGVANPIWETNLEGYTGAWVIASLVGGELGPNAFLNMYTGKNSINNPSVVKAYTAYQKLYTSGVTNPDATSRSHGDRLSGFISGNGAMVIDGGWDNGGVYDGLGKNAGQFPIPTLKGAKFPGILAGGPNVSAAVTKYSKNKSWAVKFLKFLTSPDQLNNYVKISQTEASNNVVSDPSVITNPLLRGQAADVSSRKQVYPFDNVMPGPVNDFFYKVNNSVGLGQTSPSDAAAQLAQSFADNRP